MAVTHSACFSEFNKVFLLVQKKKKRPTNKCIKKIRKGNNLINHISGNKHLHVSGTWGSPILISAMSIFSAAPDSEGWYSRRGTSPVVFSQLLQTFQWLFYLINFKRYLSHSFFFFIYQHNLCKLFFVGCRKSTIQGSYWVIKMQINLGFCGKKCKDFRRHMRF